MEIEGLSIIRTLVGHGIGREMHEDPQVPNFGEAGKGPLLEEGTVLAIEPMVNAGGSLVRMGDDGWAVYSEDGSLAAHFEFTIAVTAEGRGSSPPGTRTAARYPESAEGAPQLTRGGPLLRHRLLVSLCCRFRRPDDGFPVRRGRRAALRDQ